MTTCFYSLVVGKAGPEIVSYFSIETPRISYTPSEVFRFVLKHSFICNVIGTFSNEGQAKLTPIKKFREDMLQILYINISTEWILYETVFRP